MPMGLSQKFFRQKEIQLVEMLYSKVCPIRFGQKYRKIIQATVRSLQQYIAGFLNCWRKRMSYREALLIWFSLSEKISKMFEHAILKNLTVRN